MQCVRFGVVSSILLLLGGTWRNQNGLRLFFLLYDRRPAPDTGKLPVCLFLQQLWQKRAVFALV